jgi:hypothetical protein
MSLKSEAVKQLALDAGFKLRTQADGSEDLNPYVYDFANAVMDAYYAGVNQSLCSRCVHYEKTVDEEPCASCRPTATNFVFVYDVDNGG